MNYVIYLLEVIGAPPIVLVDGEKKRVEGFLKFWKLYRPLTTIAIIEHDDIITTQIFQGETKDAPLNF